jgi:DNA polymerase-3 subunit beta
VVIGGKAFADLVKKVSFAVAKEPTRYAMNGVLCQVRDDKLRMIGTDGRRLALVYRSLTAESTGKTPTTWEAIVPPKALNAALRALSLDAKALNEEGADTGSQQAVELRWSPSQMAISFGPTVVQARLIDGEFPQFDAVIPRSAKTTVELNRAEFERAVRKAAILAPTDVRAIKVLLDGAQMSLSSEVANLGSAQVTLEIDSKGPGGSSLYNPDYLLDFLRTTDVETLPFHFSDDNTPGKFMPEEEFIYIVMPITGL